MPQPDEIFRILFKPRGTDARDGEQMKQRTFA
jgi:hypothetical protein